MRAWATSPKPVSKRPYTSTWESPRRLTIKEMASNAANPDLEFQQLASAPPPTRSLKGASGASRLACKGVLTPEISQFFRNFFVASEGVMISPSISIRPVYPPPELPNSHAISWPFLASFAHLDPLAEFCSSQKWPSASVKVRSLECPSRSVQVRMFFRSGTPSWYACG